MAWWAWIILGAVLLGAEIIISADFYLVFFGVSSFALGVLVLAGVTLPAWGQWLLFASLAVLLLLVYRRRLKKILSRPDRELDEEIVGESGKAVVEIAPGASGQMELRGTVWSVRNVGEEDLLAGDTGRVVAIEGLVLHVRRES